jgi:16S rRNA (uracil1498-N3)-methyltransferase
MLRRRAPPGALNGDVEMPPRFFVDQPLTGFSEHSELSLPASAARHVQVLRLQPGDALTLFDGSGEDWHAEVLRMGRSEVAVRLHARERVQRELHFEVVLALAMPANDRMDALVEKATELGVSAIQPLMSERSVLRLSGERAQKKIAHWQGVAIAACEQSGRSKVPRIEPVQSLAAWLATLGAAGTGDAAQRRWLLSPGAAQPLRERVAAHPVAGQTLVLSGPEGGLSPAEEAQAREQGFGAVQLGPRILRADTAPLAVLAWLGLEQA